MRSRSPFPHGGASAGARLVALLGLVAGLGGCGDRGTTPSRSGTTTATDAGSPPPADGPLATYRLSATRAAGGDALTLEALAPCRVLLEVEQGTARDGARWRDLDPGDSLRVAWSLLADPEGASPAAAAAPPGRAGKIVAYRLRYGFEEPDTRESLLRLEARSASPWVRTAFAAAPVSAKPFPKDGVALATLAVADVTSSVGLELRAGPVPEVVGLPPGTPDAHLQRVTLRLRLSPR